MSEKQQPRRDSLVTLFLGVALAIATLLVYCPSFDYPFVNYDDDLYVFVNPQVRSGLNGESIGWAFTRFNAFWHPLTWLSLELDATVHGVQYAGGFHLTNVLLHTANVLLLFVVLRQMTGLVWRSA